MNLVLNLINILINIDFNYMKYLISRLKKDTEVQRIEYKGWKRNLKKKMQK